MYYYKGFKRPFEIQTLVCDQKMTDGDGRIEKIIVRPPQRAGASRHDPAIALARKRA